MNIKQKIIKDKNNEVPKNRYNLQPKNCDSTPSLLRARQILQNKENHMNHRNKDHEADREIIKNNQFQMLRSMEVPKRLRTSANEDEHLNFRRHKKMPEEGKTLLSSQELFNFRQRNKADRYESANFGEHLTFGDVNNKRQMMTSREFIQEKQIKNDVIDELASNARRELCKSFNEFSTNPTGNCANHANKKAKYRLISELTEGEEEMFYCSKCAINLLQQGFKIQEMRADEEGQNCEMLRSQQVAKFQLRLKALDERTRGEIQQNEHKGDLDMVQDEIYNCNKKFGEVIDFLEQMRKDRVNTLNLLFYKLENQKSSRRQNLGEMMRNMEDIQREIEEYRRLKKFSAMKENEFQFLVTTLANKMATFEETLSSSRVPSPKQRLSLEITSVQNILEKLRRGLEEEQPRTRREREITFERRAEQAPQIEEDFGCDELKKPFRILFPPDESPQYEQRSMLNSVRECPTFGQYP